ncbi:MAG: hypothetical protein EAX96_20025 [Candidatus Lokiarchaeota archaeon]|nr:hypothetical protein [Candidatus Lokiarchaeota archaeon]
MIMLDAFGYNQIFSRHSKCIYSIAQESIFGRLEPLFAYRGIQPTIFSGVYPNEHGIWMDYYFDTEHSSFKWTRNTILPYLEIFKNRIKNSYIKKIFTYPIFLWSKLIYNYSQFPRSSLIPWNLLHFFKFSMCEKITKSNILNSYLTLFDYFKLNKISFEVIDFPIIHNDADLLKKFNQTLKKSFSKDFYLFRFFDLDNILHEHGLNSPQEAKELIKINKNLEFIISSIKKKEKDFFLLIFSDTGMTNVNTIINSNYLINQIKKRIDSEFQYFIDSIMIRFKFKEKSHLKTVKNFLDTQNYGLILTEELKKRYHVDIQDTKYGDLTFILGNGNLFLPNFYQGVKRIKGMHGYISEESNLDPFLLLFNESLKPNNIKSKVRFIDILPTILDIYNISPNINYNGRSLLKFSEKL